MSADIETLFDDITRERGGVDSLGPVQLSLCRALAQALATDPINPGLIGQLTQLLPQPVKPSAGSLDLSKLSDEDLSLIERLYERAGTDAPAEPGSDREKINQLLEMNSELQRIIDAREEAVRGAEQEAAIWKRLQEGALAACDDMRKRLEAAEAAAWRAAHPDPQPAAPGQPSNVVPLARGNGSAALPR
jgi:hypothetical protein